MEKHIALYLRVSTARQAEQEVSIPDQRQRAQEYCQSRNWKIVREFVEPGRSATNDKRPVFQNMISLACSKEHPFDVVLVYAYSRFFRNAIDSGIYRRKLEKHDVQVASLTQDFGEGHDGELLKTIIAAVDEHASAENGKNTLDKMIENARQGFWNGSVPPFGYDVITVEVRGRKEKKKLQINPAQAEMVRKIFDLYLNGQPGKESMGIKAVTTWLNSNGLRKPSGLQFYTSSVFKILTTSTYCGEHYYNIRDSKTGKQKPRNQWISLEVPPIVSKEKFQRVQALLKQRHSNVTPSRIFTKCTLLSNIARCIDCKCSYMSVTSGKGKDYRYYKPASRMLKSNRQCQCKTIPMQYLDNLVMGEIKERILKPEFIGTLVGELATHRQSHDNELEQSIRKLNAEFREAQKRLNRLYESIADGRIKDFNTLNDFIEKENLRLDEIDQQLKFHKHQLGYNPPLSNRQLSGFTSKLAEKLHSGPVEFKKQILHDLIDTVEIGSDEIRITASKAVIAQMALDAKKGQTAEVRSSVRKWRASTDTSTKLVLTVKLPEKYCRS